MLIGYLTRLTVLLLVLTSKSRPILIRLAGLVDAKDALQLTVKV